MKYKPQIVLAYFEECGLPEPILEYKFHPVRKWRFDFAWPQFMVALECDGGIWIAGGHNRGAQIKATWEKENEANILGWAILKCEPKELCTQATVEMIRAALKRPAIGRKQLC
jgi:very-short-patch-repair endonuclease